jgi:hypothetical protein
MAEVLPEVTELKIYPDLNLVYVTLTNVILLAKVDFSSSAQNFVNDNFSSNIAIRKIVPVQYNSKVLCSDIGPLNPRQRKRFSVGFGNKENPYARSSDRARYHFHLHFG